MQRGRRASWQNTPIPTTLTPQSYAPLPYDTHPIDTTVGPQGWGPFGAGGPWVVDFINPQMFIDIGFSKGDNAQRHSPRYGNVTLFDDPSLDRANNTSLFGSIRGALGDVARGKSSTASNSPQVAATGARLRIALGLATRKGST